MNASIETSIVMGWVNSVKSGRRKEKLTSITS